MKSLVKINSMAANDPAFLVSKAEERYSDRLDEIAERIFSDREKRIVMLAGPSASGKTTTAGLIASRLESRGAKAFTVSLDDFYHDQRDAILDENGKPVPKARVYQYRDAIAEPIINKLYEDPTLVSFGEDVRDWGGAFAVYRGMTEATPYYRLFNTPIAEAAIVGAAVGYGMSGGRAVAEVM